MKTIARWSVVAIVTLHGLIHLMGTAEGFGWADLGRVDEPVGAGTGLLWLAAALVVLAAATAIAVRRPSWWWAVPAVAAVVSQAVILTRWSDASAGTAANVLLLLVAGYGFATRVRPDDAHSTTYPVIPSPSVVTSSGSDGENSTSLTPP